MHPQITPAQVSSQTEFKPHFVSLHFSSEHIFEHFPLRLSNPSLHEHCATWQLFSSIKVEHVSF